MKFQTSLSLFTARDRCLVRLVLILAVLLMTVACGPGTRPADLEAVLSWPQDPAFWTGLSAGDDLLLSQTAQARSAAFCRSMHFLPWLTRNALYKATRVSGDAASLRQKQLFGEHLRPRSPAFIDNLILKCNWQAYPLLNTKGVTVGTTNLRALPTCRPGFLDPSLAGEGYPFDHLQYSSLWPGTPVHVSHATVDRSWFFVETAHVYGWVTAEDLAFVPDSLAARVMSLPLGAIVRDNRSVSDESGRFLFQARIGMLLPVLTVEGRKLKCLALTADEHGQAASREVVLDNSCISPFPIQPTAGNFAGIAGEFLGQAYGWGGLFRNRDCSAFMRDFFTPFGLWLPRNSAQQARIGRFFDLTGRSAREKKRIILDRGVPFLTTITMDGHIMLFLGGREGRAAVQHAVWGLRTRNILGHRGRLVIGQNVITDLEPGKEVPELDRPQGRLLNRITGMGLLDQGVEEWSASHVQQPVVSGPEMP